VSKQENVVLGQLADQLVESDLGFGKRYELFVHVVSLGK
jgi:hypothetical protein